MASKKDRIQEIKIAGLTNKQLDARIAKIEKQYKSETVGKVVGAIVRMGLRPTVEETQAFLKSEKLRIKKYKKQQAEDYAKQQKIVQDLRKKVKSFSKNMKQEIAPKIKKFIKGPTAEERKEIHLKLKLKRQLRKQKKQLKNGRLT